MADKVVSLEVDVDVEGGESVDQLEKKLEKLEAQLKSSKGAKSFESLNKELSKTKTKLDSVKTSAKSTQGAFDKANKSTSTFKGGVDGASKSMNTFVGGGNNAKELLTELSSNLIGATAIWGAVAIAIVAAGRKLYEYVTRLNEAEKAQENLNTVRSEGTSIVSESIGQFRLLIAIIQDETEAEEQRLLAKRQLAKEYPDFNQQILDESLATDAARASIELYIVSLKKQGKAKAAASIVAEKEVEIVKEEIQLQKDREELIESIGKTGVFATGKLEDRLKEVNAIDDITEREKQLNALYEEAVSLRSKRNSQEILAENEVQRTEIRIKALERERDAILSVQIANTELKEDLVEPIKPEINKGAKDRLKGIRESKGVKKGFNEIEDAPGGGFTIDTTIYEKQQEKILSIRESFKKKLEDDDATTEVEKLALEESRVLAELELLHATEDQKMEVRKYYAEQTANAQIEIDKETAEARAQINRDLFSTVIDLAENAFEQETEMGREAFNIAKALRVAQAIGATYSAANNALESGSKINPTYGIISAIVATTTGLLNVKKILSTKVGGSTSSSVGGVPSSSLNPTQAQPQQSGFTDNRTQNITVDPIQVYVLESAITEAQGYATTTKQVSVIK